MTTTSTFKKALREILADQRAFKMLWRRVRVKLNLEIYLCENDSGCCIKLQSLEDCIEALGRFQIPFTDLESFWEDAEKNSRNRSWHLQRLTIQNFSIVVQRPEE